MVVLSVKERTCINARGWGKVWYLDIMHANSWHTWMAALFMYVHEKALDQLRICRQQQDGWLVVMTSMPCTLTFEVPLNIFVYVCVFVWAEARHHRGHPRWSSQVFDQHRAGNIVSAIHSICGSSTCFCFIHRAQESGWDLVHFYSSFLLLFLALVVNAFMKKFTADLLLLHTHTNASMHVYIHVKLSLASFCLNRSNLWWHFGTFACIHTYIHMRLTLARFCLNRSNRWWYFWTFMPSGWASTFWSWS